MMKKAFFLVICLMAVICVLLIPVTARAKAAAILYFQEQLSVNAYADLRYCPASESQEHDELQEQMQDLFEELRRLEKMFKNKMNQEVLPRIQEEIQRLKDWLEEQEKKKGEPPPQWTRQEEAPNPDLYRA